MNMPVMGGFEAAKLIREFNNKIIIIAQTANGMEKRSRRCHTAGCSDYISKPINKIELLTNAETF
jgi:CheY-like chemotaxis protein